MNDHLPIPKAAAIHDLSGFGRCALTVIIPTLSAMGIQVCPIPTAVLSTHTGDFSDYTFLDLTDQIPPYAAHWKQLGLEFDAIYSGFLANIGQIEQVNAIFDDLGGVDTLIAVDPVMGDDGRIYKTYTPELCEGMKTLVRKADLITPNITEAAYLTDTEYKNNYSTREIREILDKLLSYGCSDAVITGIRSGPNVVTAYAGKNCEGLISNPHIDKSYPGTGDIFASCLIGKLLKGTNLKEAVEFTVDFVTGLIEYSSEFDYPEREGVLLEKFLYRLISK